jgi:hypothetical protein
MKLGLMMTIHLELSIEIALLIKQVFFNEALMLI